VSFRERMSPVISAAEWEIRKQLDLRGVHMQYQKVFIMDAHSVDIYGENARQERHCFEVDGPLHRTSEKVMLRDERVTALLEKRGCKVWHLPYTPPLSQERLTEIVEFIQEKGFCGRLHIA
jgi:very-short-patch-repair endonuclease